MKRIKFSLVLCIIAAVCMLGACTSSKSATFNGSKTGDENHFDISFDILNTTYTHDFEMKQGENILVHVEKESGEIKVVIQEGQEEPIYEGNGNVTSDFSVAIPKDGTYTVSVTGKEAKGQVIFNRE